MCLWESAVGTDSGRQEIEERQWVLFSSHVQNSG